MAIVKEIIDAKIPPLENVINPNQKKIISNNKFINEESKIFIFKT